MVLVQIVENSLVSRWLSRIRLSFNSFAVSYVSSRRIYRYISSFDVTYLYRFALVKFIMSPIFDNEMA